jgi:hypothetical protein
MSSPWWDGLANELDQPPPFARRYEVDVQLELDGDLVAVEGCAVVRPSEPLRIAPARELIAYRQSRAAFEPDRSVAVDTLRLLGTRSGVEWSDPQLGELPKRSPRRVEQPVVWGGPIVSHFGHFLIESVARLWPLLPGGELHGLPVVFTTPSGVRFAAEWLTAFGAEVFELPEEPVRFSQMYVPEPCAITDLYWTRTLREIHLHARRGLDVAPLAPQGIVWLSRSQIDIPDRRVLDERLLERLLPAELTIVHPEQLSLAEQVAVVEAASGITGVVGSAFHTALLAQDAPPALYLCSDRVPSPFVLQDQLLGTDGAFVRGLAVDQPLTATRLGRNRYRLLLPETLRAINGWLHPTLLDNPRAAAVAFPERHVSRISTGFSSAEDHDVELRAVTELGLGPPRYNARLTLGDMFESEGEVDAALEQFRAAAREWSEASYPHFRVAQLLWNIGERDRARHAARRALALDPNRTEALRFATSSEAEAVDE